MGNRLCLCAVVMCSLATSTAARAQGWTPELSGGVGLGHVFRFDDRTYGDRLSAGGTAGISHPSGWAVEIHGDRIFGLSPPHTPCGLDVTCIGIGHDGPTAIATVTIGARFHLTTGRVQPYALGGLGMMWSRSLHSLTQVRGAEAIISEHGSRDHGVGPDLGAGIRVEITPRWSANAELRWLDASIQSRENLAATRVHLRMAYALK